MNKKQKIGIALIVGPFLLLFIAFILTLLSGLLIQGPNLVNVIPLIMGLLGVIGIIFYPILAIVGVLLIVKNKEPKTEPTEEIPTVNNQVSQDYTTPQQPPSNQTITPQ